MNTTIKQSLQHTAFISPKLAMFLLANYWPLIVAAITIIFVGIGLRDPWPADEPRFALIAKEMVDTGQWFFPARGQELYPDKPPVFMWSIAIFYWLTDSLRIAFLLPNALCSLLTLFLTVDIAKRLWSKPVAIVAGWLLLFSFQFTLQAKTAQIDAMVCAWMTVACYGLLRYCIVDGERKWYLIAWFFMGLGVITKGVGFLPMLMLIPYCIYRMREQQLGIVPKGGALFWVAGLPTMLFAISVWFIPMLLIVDASNNAAYELYRDNILFKQTLTRYANSWHHIKPFWYYIVSVIPLFWLPVSLMIPWLLKPWLNAWKTNNPRILLPLGYVVLVIIFFSLSPGKRGVYLLPALPMFVLCVAPFCKRLFKQKWIVNLTFELVFLIGFVLLATGLLGLFDLQEMTAFANKLGLNPWWFFLTVGIASTIALFLVWGKNRLLAWPIFMSVLWMTYSTYGYHLRNDASTPIVIFNNAQEQITARGFDSDDITVALIDFSEQFLLFSPYKMVHFGYHTPPNIQLKAAYQWQKASDLFVLLEEQALDEKCYDIEKAIELGYRHRRHWLLLPVEAKKETCNVVNSNFKIFKFTNL